MSDQRHAKNIVPPLNLTWIEDTPVTPQLLVIDFWDVKLPKVPKVSKYINIFRFNTATSFPKIFFRQIFSSLTFRP